MTNNDVTMNKYLDLQCKWYRVITSIHINVYEKNRADFVQLWNFLLAYPSGQGGILTFRTPIILFERKCFNLKSLKVIWDVHSVIWDYRMEDGLFGVFRIGTSG